MTRRSTAERGYTGDHERLRQQWAPIVAAGGAQCRAARCVYGNRWIPPGTPWDLGHFPDRSGWTGPEHARCNRAEGAARGNRHRGTSTHPNRRKIAVKYTTIGAEITQDRTKTWLALAGAEDGRVIVELLAPLDGTDAVPLIDQLYGQHPIDTVAIDPRSAAATLLAGLETEGIPLQLADAVALAIAHGRFLDWTTAGKLRHRGDRALTEAVRQAAAKRTTSGAQSVDRGVHADPAPLVAAELAVWALGDTDTDTTPIVAF